MINCCLAEAQDLIARMLGSTHTTITDQYSSHREQKRGLEFHSWKCFSLIDSRKMYKARINDLIAMARYVVFLI